MADWRILVATLSVVALAFFHGGAEDLVPRAAIGVFALGAFGAVVASSRAAWPPAALALCAVPLLQLVPIPIDLWARLSPMRAEILAPLASIGIAPRASVSIDAATTLHAALLLGAAVAAFVLARSGARKGSAAAIGAGILALAAAAQAVIGAEQYVAGLSSGVGEAVARGTFVSRGHLAAFLEGGLGAALGLAAASFASRTRYSFAGTVAALALAAACVAGTALSLSRAGTLVVAAELMVGVWLFAPRVRRAAPAVVLLALIAGLSTAPDVGRRLEGRFGELAGGGDTGRLAIWRDTLPLIAQNPVVGVGLGAYPYAFRRQAPYLVRKSVENAHNDYLELALELGLPAFLLLVTVVGSAAVGAVRGARRLEPPERALAFGCLLGAGAILAHAVVDFPLRLPATALLWACLLGLACGLSRRTADGRWGRPLSAVAAGGLAVLACLQPTFATPLQKRFAAAETAFASASDDAGLDDARRRFVELLAGNPYVAPAWLRLAALERGAGRPEAALRLTRIAHQVEPHTLRTSWTLAEAEMLYGDRRRGFERLVAITSTAPDLRPTAYRVAWRAGVSLDEIERDLAAADDPHAAGEYLAFLTRIEVWDRIPSAYRSLAAELSPAHRGYLRKTLLASAHAQELARLEELGFR